MSQTPAPRMFPARSTTLLLLVCAALFLVGCSAGEQTDSADAQAYVAGDGSVTELPTSQRQAAPQVTGTDLDGKPLDLADLQGKVVVLNVWASWCSPCRAEAPELAEVYSSTDRKDVAFVGLATRDSAASAAAFARRFDLTYPHLLDADGSQQLLFRDTLPPQAIPSTLIIDREGRVAARVLGEVSAPTLRGLIDPLVADDKPGASS